MRSDGSAWGWVWMHLANSADDTTGLSSCTCRPAPVQVVGVGGTGMFAGVAAVVGGGYHSLALKTDGTVWAWGLKSFGELGDATTTTRLSPVQVSGLTTATSLGAGDIHSRARLSDGTVRTWGDNSYGELGNGTRTTSQTPIQASAPSGLTQAAPADRTYPPSGGSSAKAVKTRLRRFRPRAVRSGAAESAPDAPRTC